MGQILRRRRMHRCGMALMLCHIGPVLGEVEIRWGMLLAPIAAPNPMHVWQKPVVCPCTPAARHPSLTRGTEEERLAKGNEVTHDARGEQSSPSYIANLLQPARGAFFGVVSGKDRERHLLSLAFHAI